MTVEVRDEGLFTSSMKEWQKQKRRKSKRVRSEDVEINAWLKFINGETNKMPLVPEEVSEEKESLKNGKDSEDKETKVHSNGYSAIQKRKERQKSLWCLVSVEV